MEPIRPPPSTYSVGNVVLVAIGKGTYWPAVVEQVVTPPPVLALPLFFFGDQTRGTYAMQKLYPWSERHNLIPRTRTPLYDRAVAEAHSWLELRRRWPEGQSSSAATPSSRADGEDWSIDGEVVPHETMLRAAALRLPASGSKPPPQTPRPSFRLVAPAVDTPQAHRASRARSCADEEDDALSDGDATDDCAMEERHSSLEHLEFQGFAVPGAGHGEHGGGGALGGRPRVRDRGRPLAELPVALGSHVLIGRLLHIPAYAFGPVSADEPPYYEARIIRVSARARPRPGRKGGGQDAVLYFPCDHTTCSLPLKGVCGWLVPEEEDTAASLAAAGLGAAAAAAAAALPAAEKERKGKGAAAAAAVATEAEGWPLHLSNKSSTGYMGVRVEGSRFRAYGSGLARQQVALGTHDTAVEAALAVARWAASEGAAPPRQSPSAPGCRGCRLAVRDGSDISDGETGAASEGPATEASEEASEASEEAFEEASVSEASQMSSAPPSSRVSEAEEEVADGSSTDTVKRPAKMARCHRREGCIHRQGHGGRCKVPGEGKMVLPRPSKCQRLEYCNKPYGHGGRCSSPPAAEKADEVKVAAAAAAVMAAAAVEEEEQEKEAAAAEEEEAPRVALESLAGGSTLGLDGTAWLAKDPRKRARPAALAFGTFMQRARNLATWVGID